MTRWSRFIILSQPRNGTHFVGGLLNTHPHVCCMDEPMNPAVNRADIPARTIADLIWQDADWRASGFIVHWNQHTEIGGLGEGFLNDVPADVRVIWVVRRDALAAIVSRKIAEITGRWQSSEPTTETLTLSAAELTAAYDELMSEREAIGAWMRQRSAGLMLAYEDARRDPDMANVQSFLEVPFAPLDEACCGVTKQERRPLAEAVANYEDLQRELAGTPLAPLFLPQHVAGEPVKRRPGDAAPACGPKPSADGPSAPSTGPDDRLGTEGRPPAIRIGVG